MFYRTLQTSFEQKQQKLRTNKIKRNWYLKHAHILFLTIMSERHHLPKAEVLRRLLDIIMMWPEDDLDARIRKA